MRLIPACPACETAERSPVFDHNSLVLLESYQGTEMTRYGYALCHGCGLVYATQRPDADEYRFLLDNFDENLGRPRENALSSRPLSPEREHALRAQLPEDWRAADEGAAGAGWEALHGLVSTRARDAVHLDLLAASIDLRGKRVLECRAEGGLLDGLRNVGADPYALPAFSDFQLIIRELYGIPADELLDFEDFSIPYEGGFDLIICRHMLTHTVRLDEFLSVLGEHLTPDGLLYFYMESDDTLMFERNKNLLGEMKCFHMQNFDLPTLTRVLGARGFSPEYVRHVPGKATSSGMSGFARRSPTTDWTPMSSEELEQRRSMYRDWRDLSLAGVPKEVRPLVVDDEAALERDLLERGLASVNEKGRVVTTRRMKLSHQEGFQKLNRKRRDGEVTNGDQSAVEVTRDGAEADPPRAPATPEEQAPRGGGWARRLTRRRS